MSSAALIRFEFCSAAGQIEKDVEIEQVVIAGWTGRDAVALQAHIDELAEMGIPLQGSTPMVIMGEGHSIAHVSKTPVIGIPFSTPHGDFYVEFSFE